MKRILVIDGHPRLDSFCNALAISYADGAKNGGHDVRLVHLRDLQFDPILREKKMPLEPDLINVQKDITWCQHLVVVSPMWWFGTPALLKGFFDRILTPGFAYKNKRSISRILPRVLPERLLGGRSARVIYTHDGFRLLIRWGLGDPFWRTLKWGTLWYCGFSPVRRTSFSRVFRASDIRRKRWLKKTYRLGKSGH